MVLKITRKLGEREIVFSFCVLFEKDFASAEYKFAPCFETRLKFDLGLFSYTFTYFMLLFIPDNILYTFGYANC